MANRFFQGVIHQLKEVMERDIGVVDDSGIIVACSNLSDIGNKIEGLAVAMADERGFIKLSGITFMALGSDGLSGNYAFVHGTDEVAEQCTAIISVSLWNLKQFFDDKYDKNNFIKNILFDNILPSDVYAKSKDLGFTFDARRIVMIVSVDGKVKGLLSDIVQKVLGDKGRELLVSVSEREVAVVAELGNADADDTYKIAQNLSDAVTQQSGVKCTVGLSMPAANLRELARAYKEAQLSLDIGNVFNKGKTVMSYDNLGIGRLIYQMPTTLCEMFLVEVFKRGSIDCLDDETLITIEKFFENNLNVSETARKLFVHRNTLVYRLEKIKKLTGLDIRDFDNAIVFKMALMVNSYLSANDKKY
ncbi:MAG TPA: helix-turn-helix domain-containing protein [Candidatus Acidoferrum sp.]|nr:helix-turn-helix domain-containing protein [Candidatus Acidoferrum sp.]